MNEAISVADNIETDYFRKSGIELVENTPEEILDGTIEMDERVKECWEENPEDVDLQERFWEIIETNGVFRPPQLRICAVFLRQNKELF